MKIKRIIGLLLGVISMFSFVSFSSCTPTIDDSTKENDVDSRVVAFADFETFNPDFQLLRLENGFGRVDVNKNSTYVKSGEASAQLRPLGRYKDKAKPFLYLQLDSELYNYSYGDLKYLYSASMWLYNDSTETKSTELGIVTKIDSLHLDNRAKQAGGVNYTLKPGWNKLTYFVDREMIVIPDGGTKVVGLYVQFENTPSYDIADAPVFYMDDVSLTLTTKFHEIIVEEPTYSPNEGETILIPEATLDGGKVTYTVTHNNKFVTVNNGAFVANGGGEFYINYTGTVNGFVYRKMISIFVKPSNAVEVLKFDQEAKLGDLVPTSAHIEELKWLESFKGENGVVKITSSKDWPAATFMPKYDIDAYRDCEYLVMRIYYASGDNQGEYITLCDRARPEGYANHVDYDKWVSYKFPIKPFLDNFNRPFFITHQVNYRAYGFFYISEIYAM